MRVLVRLAARLYPPAWRRRYGDEFQALLEEQPPRLRDVLDVARGGLIMGIRYNTVGATAALCALITAAAAGAAAMALPDRFESSALLALSAPGVPADDYRRLLDSLRSGLSAGSMTPIAARFGTVTPVPDDLMAKLRNNVTVSRAGDTRVIQISFVSAEPRVAYEVARDLAGHVERLELGSLALRVIDQPDVPTRAKNDGRTAVAAAGGAGGGALLGATLGLFRRRRQTT